MARLGQKALRIKSGSFMIISLVAAVALAAIDQTPPAAKAATPAPAPAVAQPKVGGSQSQVQEACSVVVNNAAGEAVATPFPALQLGSVTASTGLPPLPASGVTMVRCERSQFGMGDQDWRVITDYRLPLLIVAPEAAAVLELQEGQFRLRMLKGGLTDEGAAVFRQVLDKATVDANARAARMSPAAQPAAQKQGSGPSAAPAQAKQPARR